QEMLRPPVVVIGRTQRIQASRLGGDPCRELVLACRLWTRTPLASFTGISPFPRHFFVCVGSGVVCWRSGKRRRTTSLRERRWPQGVGATARFCCRAG